MMNQYNKISVVQLVTAVEIDFVRKMGIVTVPRRMKQNVYHQHLLLLKIKVKKLLNQIKILVAIAKV